MLHCEEGNLIEVKRILETYASDINIETANDNGFTALALAIKNRSDEVAQYLIAKGANVNSLNKVIPLFITILFIG